MLPCSLPVVLALVAIVAGPAPATAQAAAPAPASPASQDYVYPAGSGLLFFYVHPERASDFEVLVGKLSDVLAASTDDTRRRQAASWQAFRSREPVGGSSVFVFLFNPVVAGADYDPVKVLSEKQPIDIQPLYEKLRESTIRVERMGLIKLR